MTAWKRWRPQRWHGWAVCSPQRFDAAQERGITSVRSGVSSEMLFLSFSKLVSRILWLNKICENKTESGSRNVKTRFSSKFGQVTPQICWLILKVFLLSYQYSASIFESRSFGDSALRGTTHNLAWARLARSKLLQIPQFENPCGREFTCQIQHVSTRTNCNTSRYVASWAWQPCKKAEQLHFVHDL